MSEPFTPQMVSDLCRAMSDERLSIIRPHDFQRWPVKRIVQADLIAEIIANEKARRKRNAG